MHSIHVNHVKKASQIEDTGDTEDIVVTGDIVDTEDTVHIDRIVARNLPGVYEDIRQAFFKMGCELLAIKAKDQWTAQGLLYIKTKLMDGLRGIGIEVSGEELSSLVGDVWKGLRFGGGAGIFTAAWIASESIPVPKCAEHFTDKRIQRLAAFCLALHKSCGGRFILPCRTAQEFFGLQSHRQPAEWMRMLVKADVLAVTERPKRPTREGFRYAFIGKV
jgi:hypothetical protein